MLEVNEMVGRQGRWKSWRWVFSLVVLGACQSSEPNDGESGAGYLYYTSDSSGSVEVWAIADTGGDPIQITDGLMSGASAGALAHDPLPSWDGSQFVINMPIDANGVEDGISHLWVFAPDGSALRHLVDANIDGSYFGMAWYGDNQRLLFSDSEVCSNNLIEVEVATGQTLSLYDVDGIAAFPSINPINDDDILFAEQECGTFGTTRRLKPSTGDTSVIPDIPEDTAIYRGSRWSSDGTRFPTIRNNAMYVHDQERSFEVYQNPDPLRTISTGQFGNEGDKIYGKTCLEATDCDIYVFDIQSGELSFLEVPNVAADNVTAHVNWVKRTIDIDTDGDGIANGIDQD